MRRSSSVTLVLIGLAGLAGCGEDDARRDVYRTREDCLADWGNRPQDCTPSKDPKHQGMGYFIGPSFRSTGSGMGWNDSSSSSSGSTRRSIGSSSVSRGGFGSSSSSSSS